MLLSSSLKLVVSPSSPVTGSIGPDVKVKTVAMVKRAHDLPQVRGKKEQKHQALKTLTVLSRRDMASHLAVASLVEAALFLPEPAQARIVKPEIKRKIFEKLKMLREKAGLSEPKTENEEKTAPTPPSEKEKKVPLPRLPISPLPVQKRPA